MSFDERVQKLNEVQRGWVNNFRMASMLAKLKDVDGQKTHEKGLHSYARYLQENFPAT